jgi:hypothetical protein
VLGERAELGQGLRLNLGCGSDILAGWVNVDRYPAAGVDQIVDLEHVPWPWADSSVEEVRLKHVLEHLGRETEVFFGVIRELWRVCGDDARIDVTVPHPRHDDFLNDPTHVRPITDGTLHLFDQRGNRESQRLGHSNTPLGLMIGVDFRIESAQFFVDTAWMDRHQRGELSYEELNHAARHFINVAREFRIIWRAVKPAGRPLTQ